MNGHTNGFSYTTHLNPTPPKTSLTSKCHPHVHSISGQIHDYFLAHWNFQDGKTRQKFLAADFPRVTCLYFPEALDDRIMYACRLLSLLFLIDDLLENMSFEEGSQYNERLMPLCRGEAMPDLSVPVEYMTYELWNSMRTKDQRLANNILEPTFRFMKAQTCKDRLSIKELGRYFEYRQHDVGKALLSSLMCFTMGINLSPQELESVAALENNCSRHIATVNDICSFEKEAEAAQSGHHEGGALCSSVPILALETGVSTEAAKRILWFMCREWETCHRDLAQGCIGQGSGECSDDLRAYIVDLEYQMSGNELWSCTTARYKSRKA